jgi:protein SCO1/2
MKCNPKIITILSLALLYMPLGEAIHRGQAKERWQLTDVTGHLPDLRFTLIADNGQAVTEQEYKNTIILLYFGFTGCASQCPLTLTRLNRLLQSLGSDTEKLRILFVTLNSKNDTPKILHDYLAACDPAHMVGLTGSDKMIEALAKRYRAAYRAADTADIPHSNVIYIFDRAGQARLLALPEDSEVHIVNDIGRLIHEH